MKPMILEVNATNGETLEREMTDVEYAQWLIDTGEAPVEA
jgi:hypothetical protein